MTREELKKLHQKHMDYMFEHSPADYILEDRGIDTYREPSSDFVISAGGDVITYRIVGVGPEFKIYER